MENKRKKINIMLSTVLIILVIFSFGVAVVKYLIDNHMLVTMKAVVVKVKENSLMLWDMKDQKYGLYRGVYAKEDNIELKQGQEILIYYDGTISTIYPGIIDNIGKIKIIKEQSDLTIPEDILRQCYSSEANVSASINELTNAKLLITIIDNNELPYEYSNHYTIYRKVKNENYTGQGYKIGEDTEHSTSGFSRNRIRI